MHAKQSFQICKPCALVEMIIMFQTELYIVCDAGKLTKAPHLFRAVLLTSMLQPDFYYIKTGFFLSQNAACLPICSNWSS